MPDRTDDFPGGWLDKDIEDPKKIQYACERIRWDINPFTGLGLSDQIACQYLRCMDFDSADLIFQESSLFPTYYRHGNYAQRRMIQAYFNKYPKNALLE
jgi:hypothetical protein